MFLKIENRLWFDQTSVMYTWPHSSAETDCLVPDTCSIAQTVDGVNDAGHVRLKTRSWARACADWLADPSSAGQTGLPPVAPQVARQPG